jgi:hypothetical protein
MGITFILQKVSRLGVAPFLNACGLLSSTLKHGSKGKEGRDPKFLAISNL